MQPERDNPVRTQERGVRMLRTVQRVPMMTGLLVQGFSCLVAALGGFNPVALNFDGSDSRAGRFYFAALL